jgi:hypothetical protein
MFTTDTRPFDTLRLVPSTVDGRKRLGRKRATRVGGVVLDR